jgi:Ca-activated chloride channel family protein
MTMLRARPLITGLALLGMLRAGGVTGVAHQQATPTFNARVDLIQLDVSVVDKEHQPVRGLTQHDFTITEDGKAQPIQTFAAIDLVDDPPRAPGWMREVAPDVTSNTGVEEERLIVIFMDDYATDVKDDLWATRSAKEIGRGVIERLGPRDLAARFHPSSNLPEQLGATHMLERVAGVLGSVTQRRKILVWVTPGVIPPTSNLGTIIHAANLANVNVYPIDPAGLRVADVDTAAAVADPTSADAFKANVERGNSHDRLTALQDHLLAIAANTGGHAFQLNKFTASLNQVFRETGSFYLLGYASSNTTADGKYRRLQVKVNRPGVTVNTRAGYFGADPPNVLHPAPPPPSPAMEALSGLVPKRGVPLRIVSAPFATTGTPAVAVALGLTAPQGAAGDVDVVLEAFTFDGVLKQSEKFRAHLEPAAGATAPDVEILTHVDLPPGRYQLRAGVTSARLGTSGSVYGDLDVPDFGREPLSLSGVVLSSMPPPAVEGYDAIARLVPGAPTTRRSFAATDQCLSFFTVYQGGGDPIQPVTMRVSIRNDADKIVLTRADALEAVQFGATRGADHRFALPLGALTPGEYVLTIEVTLGKDSARRDVRFTIR